MKGKIKLGDEVRDTITGFKGVAISRIAYYTGCIQYGVKAKMKDGKIAEPEYFDEVQLEPVIKKEKQAPMRTSGGDQPDRPKKS